jgi:hypothetical protein
MRVFQNKDQLASEPVIATIHYRSDPVQRETMAFIQPVVQL